MVGGHIKCKHCMYIGAIIQIIEGRYKVYCCACQSEYYLKLQHEGTLDALQKSENSPRKVKPDYKQISNRKRYGKYRPNNRKADTSSISDKGGKVEPVNEG